MFVVKNAWRSVVRNKGRNILIAIIVAVIAAAATIGLAIRNAAETARESGLNSTTVTATISVDRDAMMNKAKEAADSSDSSSGGAPDFDSMRSALNQDSLSLDDYNKYAEASSVDVSTYYTETTSVNATSKFQPVESSTSNASKSSDSSSDSKSSDSSSDNKQGGPSGQGGDMGGMTSGDFSLVGFSSDTAVANASNGTFTMSDGQVFGYDSDSDGDVIISKTLAEFNNLKVGSTITVADLSSSKTTYKLTVVGIYENSSSNSFGMGGPMGGTSSDPDNAIYTSISTLKKLGLSTESKTSSNTSSSRSATQLSYSYVLGSKDDYETFSTDATNAGLSDEYKVSSADVEQYESSLVPLNNLSSFALTLLLIVLAVGAVVLVVLNLFNVRERKYEIGVLTAIGINKIKVIAQFVLELLIVTMIGIAVGVGAGAVASVPVSNALLAQQISSQETTQSNQMAQFGREADMGGGPGGGGQEPPSNDSADNSSNDSSSTSTDSNTTDNKSSEAPDNQQGGGFPGFDKAANYVSEVNATVNFKVVGQLILIGLALTLISALVGVIAIIRYEPLQILADRS